MAAAPSPRPSRAFTVALVVIIVVLVTLSVVLAVLYTVPMKKIERTDASWFGANLVTTGTQPSEAAYVLPESLCAPSNAVGNLTISLVWQSSFVNTTAYFFWTTPPTPPIYWVNNSSQGGYSFPPEVSTLLCHEQALVICHWYTSEPGATITLNGVREYNYTATEPLW